MTQPGRELRQGDWLDINCDLPILTAPGQPERVQAATNGVVVITQCCDLAQNYTGIVHIAPVITLDGNDKANALRGSTSRYAHLAADHFVDLAVIVSIARTACDDAPIRLQMTDSERQAFAGRISRRFARYAYPDVISHALGPLKKAVRSKATKNSAIGGVLKLVETLRLECEPDWNADTGLTLTLLIVVNNDELPPLDEPTPNPGMAGMAQFLGSEAAAEVAILYGANPLTVPGIGLPKPTLDEAAQRILAAGPDNPIRGPLWDVFGEVLADTLRKGAAEATDAGLIDDIDVEVMRADEFTYSRFRASVDLDLDDLSPPATIPET
ncbi:hypothetical protein ONA92_27050 [Mycobacteroides salmoniphilum]|uniref:hypothetical protein n=1 Tax=Mycobacteroides salmoniphilum TaxID=404941 RepID=UPI003561EC86